MSIYLHNYDMRTNPAGEQADAGQRAVDHTTRPKHGSKCTRSGLQSSPRGLRGITLLLLTRGLPLKRVGHEASVGSLGDKGMPRSHNLKAQKAEGTEQGGCGGDAIRSEPPRPPAGPRALPAQGPPETEGPSLGQGGCSQGVVRPPDGMDPTLGLASRAVGSLSHFLSPAWRSPTSVIAVLMEANEDVVSAELLLSKLEENCEAEVPASGPARPCRPTGALAQLSHFCLWPHLHTGSTSLSQV